MKVVKHKEGPRGTRRGMSDNGASMKAEETPRRFALSILPELTLDYSPAERQVARAHGRPPDPGA